MVVYFANLQNISNNPINKCRKFDILLVKFLAKQSISCSGVKLQRLNSKINLAKSTENDYLCI